jgi:5,6,7,8-tetrahydromethanopterin hydro-lyase
MTRCSSVRLRLSCRQHHARLFVCVGVFIHWDAADNKKIQDYNYRATKEAIARAIDGDPNAAEVIVKRNVVKHPFAA